MGITQTSLFIGTELGTELYNVHNLSKASNLGDLTHRTKANSRGIKKTRGGRQQTDQRHCCRMSARREESAHLRVCCTSTDNALVRSTFARLR